MIAMPLTKPKTETEGTVLVVCEKCGDVTQYDAAHKAGWIAVGGGPWRYRCNRHGCSSGKVEFVGEYKTECQSCGHVEYHDEITDFAEERCDECDSLSFGQKKVTRK